MVPGNRKRVDTKISARSAKPSVSEGQKEMDVDANVSGLVLMSGTHAPLWAYLDAQRGFFAIWFATATGVGVIEADAT